MSARQHPDLDETTFSLREAAQLIGRSGKCVRRLCRKVPGFAVQAEKGGVWRISPIHAAVARALLKENRRIGAAEFRWRTAGGAKAFRNLGLLYIENPAVRALINTALLEDPMARWFERQHRRTPPSLNNRADDRLAEVEVSEPLHIASRRAASARKP
jgi:hypothetical protein